MCDNKSSKKTHCERQKGNRQTGEGCSLRLLVGRRSHSFIIKLRSQTRRKHAHDGHAQYERGRGLYGLEAILRGHSRGTHGSMVTQTHGISRHQPQCIIILIFFSLSFCLVLPIDAQSASLSPCPQSNPIQSPSQPSANAAQCPPPLCSPQPTEAANGAHQPPRLSALPALEPSCLQGCQQNTPPWNPWRWHSAPGVAPASFLFLGGVGWQRCDSPRPDSASSNPGAEHLSACNGWRTKMGLDAI